MHFAGGVAIAFFFQACFQTVPATAISRGWRRAAEIVFIFCATATVAVFWEFTEYSSDALFSTRALADVNDTLQDLLVGICGSAFFILASWLTGLLGRIRPIE